MMYIIRCYDNKTNIHYYAGYERINGKKIPAYITKRQYENLTKHAQWYARSDSAKRDALLCLEHGKFKHVELVKVL